jgi:hypothetical protein
MKIKTGYLLLFICFVSCEKALNVTLPYEGNKFVIFGELSPESVVSIQIERTFPPTGEVTFSNSYLNSIKVVLIEDSQEVDELKRVDNSTIFYSAKLYKPKVGKTYKVRVEAPDFLTAESEPVLIPPPIKITNFGFAEKEVFSPLNQQVPTKLLSINFEELPATATYFVAEIVGVYNQNSTSANVISDMTIPDFGSPCAFTFTSRKQIFNGECFNKQQNTVSFFVELEGTAETSINQFQQKKIDAVSIKLSSTTKFYLDFYSQLLPTEGIFKAFETSRATVTNIKNGYGAILTKNETTVIYTL